MAVLFLAGVMHGRARAASEQLLVMVHASRVQHDDSRGPYKGGLRYHPKVDLDDVRR